MAHSNCAPCLICTPLDRLPDGLRQLAAEFRPHVPAPDRLQHVQLPPSLASAERCWNCRGRGVTVQPPAAAVDAPPSATTRDQVVLGECHEDHGGMAKVTFLQKWATVIPDERGEEFAEDLAGVVLRTANEILCDTRRITTGRA